MHESSDRCRKPRVPRLLVLVAAASVLLVPLAGRATEVDPVETGRLLFRIYCATCHGETARGDGTTAAYLTVKPPDLTKLSRRNGGEFPEQKTREIIDGRAVVRGHGNREMPLWGLAFQDWAVDRNQESEVQARIEQLVRYLESIQKK